MGLGCTGQMFSDWVNNSLGTVSFTILDTNGVTHSASGYPTVTSTTSVTILVFDGSSSSYTASELQISYSKCSTPIITFSVSGQKAPYMALVFSVTISINDQPNQDPIVTSIVNLIGGVKPPLSFTAQGEANEVTYSTTTTSSGTTCTTNVSSTGSVSTGVSVSGSGSTITLTATFSYGSCQQIQYPKIVMYLGSSSSPAVTGFISGFPQPSPECGYNQSCSYTITANVTVS
jgi:hypothetical protein